MVEYFVCGLVILFTFAAGWLIGYASGRFSSGSKVEPWPPDWEPFEDGKGKGGQG